jgi:hypothetical protein
MQSMSFIKALYANNPEKSKQVFTAIVCNQTKESFFSGKTTEHLVRNPIWGI